MSGFGPMSVMAGDLCHVPASVSVKGELAGDACVPEYLAGYAAKVQVSHIPSEAARPSWSEIVHNAQGHNAPFHFAKYRYKKP